MIQLELKEGELILGSQKLEGIEKHLIKISSELPKGTAELELKMLVKFAGNTKEQNPIEDLLETGEPEKEVG